MDTVMKSVETTEAVWAMVERPQWVIGEVRDGGGAGMIQSCSSSTVDVLLATCLAGMVMQTGGVE